ncbi:hypothetical protein ACJJTC_016454 [Scirpophaga incertulas]
MVEVALPSRSASLHIESGTSTDNNKSTETPSTQAQKKLDTCTDNNMWQRDKPPQQRQKRKVSSPIQSNHQKKVKSTTTYTVPTENRFDVLEIENNTTEKSYIPKPEPIFVTGVIDVKILKQKLNEIIDGNLYTMVTLRSGHVIKLMPADISTYKIIRDNFSNNNIAHYTYQLKS